MIGKRIIQIFVLLFSGLALSTAQQDIKVDIYPQTSRAIEGQLNLNRTKYFNLSADGTNIEAKIGDQARFDYYFKELKMTLGRSLGMVGSEVQWGNSVREDPERPGYTDLDYLLSKQNPSNAGASADFMSILGDNQNVVCHDRHNSYPDFMDLYTKTGSSQTYPGNTDAAAELASTLLKHKFTDWTRPAFFEPVNEPDWRYWSDSRFIEFHTSIHEQTHALNLPVEVGGPCLSVAYFYKNKFQALNQITGFMDLTMMELDFYSYHIYNFMHWDEEIHDFAGSITSGLPSEGVFDAIANYAINKFGKEFTFVGSEQGAYISDGSEEEVTEMLGQKYFPGSGFDYTMEKRSIEDFLAVSSHLTNTMTFMNHPHIVKKSVPFILLEAADWDPTYDAVLLVKEDFNKSKGWVESKRIHFYEFFKDVEGRRILSFCNDNDIQHHAFVEDNRLILLFNNQSNVEGNIDLQIHDMAGEVKEIRARKLGRNIDFRPYLTEERLFSLEEAIPIRAREAIVVTIEYDQDIAQDHILNELVHYGDGTSVQFSGSHDFTVEIPDYENAEYAILRVGIGLSSSNSKNVNFAINGTAIESFVEDCADRLSGGGDYGSTRIMRLDTSLLQATNTITVTFPDGQNGGVGATVIRAGYLSSDPLEGIALKQESLSLYENQTDSLQLEFTPETTNELALSWESLDPAIATVSPEGTIRGESVGSTSIVVHSQSGSYTDTCAITVKTQDLISKADKSGWIAVWADDESPETGEGKEMAIDNNPATMWHTQWKEKPWKPLPHEIWVDMVDTLTFDRFFYTPRQDQWGPNGNIGQYELYFSNDSADWGAAAHTGEFSWNIGEEDYYKEIQEISLGVSHSARFFRLVALTEHENNSEISHTNAAELDVASELSGITFSEDTIRISVGENRIADIFSLPFVSTIPGDQVSWSSSDLTVVEVSNGEIRGSGQGEAELIATTFDGSFSDTCLIITDIILVSELNISEQQLALHVGEPAILSASINPENAYFDSYTWSSDNEEVAWVELGYVTAEKAGTANIIVTSTDGIHKDSCLVTVSDQKFKVDILVNEWILGIPVYDADVVVGTESGKTNMDGIAAFELAWGENDYSLSKSYFESYSGSIFIRNDSLVSLTLERLMADLKFEVSDASGLLTGAGIQFNGLSGETNSEGVYTFQAQGVNKEYDYEVAMEGYESVMGVVDLVKDTTVMVQLTEATGIENGNLAALSFYPNPVDNILHVEVDVRLLFQVVSMEGSILKEVNLEPGDHKISMQDYPAGIYLLRFTSENEMKIKALSVIH